MQRVSVGMVRRRDVPADESGDLLPVDLLWNAERASDRWWDYSEPVPDWWPSDAMGWHRLQARRRLAEARREFLAGRMSCPAGVDAVEFLRAHGFTARDVGDKKTRHLSY
jgi:hypothetical protein